MAAMEVEAGEGSSRFQLLSPRPPTPPRETSHESQSLLSQQAVICRPLDPRHSLQTPPNVHSPTSSTKTGSSRRKKVEFSTQAEYKEPPIYVDGSSAQQNPTPVSAPPPSSSRPVKSILKVAYGPNPLDPSSPDGAGGNPSNIVAMLDSTIQELAGSDRNSKLDAYMMLVRALKTSNNLPDRIALQNKMSLFMQFIQRDMMTKTPAGSPDATLINHSLTLLSTFLHFPAIASTLSNDFGVFILDHCIRSFEDATCPKDIVRHLMHAVALQNFSSKVMTLDRVGRLVAALHKIDNHLNGKSIIMSRVLIYRRLVKQCKLHMLTHSDWLLDLFTDMLSNLKEIRSSAISLGLEAAFALGREKQITRRVMEIFQMCPEDATYLEFYTGQLQSMTKDKQLSPSVPQIWSVVMLFIRSPDRWDHFWDWLRLIQGCFNSSDYQTKQEANFAWNRLVYAIHLEERCFSKMIGTLAQPLSSQLKRKGTAKHAEDLRKVVLGGVCNLFYYAFRPTINLKHLDMYWDNTVKSILKPLLQQPSERPEEETAVGLSQASIILTGLFDCSTPRLWKEDHVAESPLVKPEELPAIDAKWLRKNAARVFEVIGPILEQNFLEMRNHRSETYKLWQTLVKAVASAASKEIKVSMDTAVFIGHVLGEIAKIWAKGLHDPRLSDNSAAVGFLASMREFILTMVDAWGLLPFTEKLFSRDKKHLFVPLATPSQRLGKGQGGTHSPLHHLFSILSSLPPKIPDDDDFTDFLRFVFAPFFTAKSGRGRMDLAQEMLQLVPAEALCPYGPWQLVSEKIIASLDSSQSSHRTASSSSETPLGNEFRDVVRVLERGLRSIPNLPWIRWQALFGTLADRVRDEAGDAGLAICVTEPLAKLILETREQNPTLPVNAVKATVELLSVSTQPRDRLAIDAARRRLWGTANTGSRSSSFDPLDNLYKLVNTWLQAVYDDLDGFDAADFVVPFVSEVSAFIERCNPQLLVKTLVCLQEGICCWIRDEKTQLNSRQSSAVAESTKRLWDIICAALGGVGRPELLPLDDLESLLCAAFESKHRHIVNTVSTMWNSVFSQVDEVQYPEKLKALLLSRRSFVDLVLPGLETSSIESGAQQPDFIDSQEDMNVFNRESPKSDHRPSSRPASSGRSRSPLPVKLTIPMKRPLAEPSPASGAAKVARRGPARLRHDDSQVQFAPISSSPSCEDAQVSQVLTERQKEVRERQRENTALYSDMQASSSPKEKLSSRPVSPLPVNEEVALPPQMRARTPDVDGGFEDFITSTPTPRRGHAIAVAENDHDLADPPSSPPEPRRYPLVPEIQSRSSSSSILDEWQFSSSPISGSPTTAPQTAPEPPTLPVLDDISSDPHAQSPSPSGEEQVLPSLPAALRAGEAGQDVSEIGLGTSVEGEPVAQVPSVPSTPRRALRSTTAQETPKSDNDVFVDALTSPSKHSPESEPRITRSSTANRRKRVEVQPTNASFVASDIDEGSMLRIANEIDEQHRPIPAHNPVATESSAAPPQASGSDGQAAIEAQVLDCITVKIGSGDEEENEAEESSLSLPVIASTPVDELDDAHRAHDSTRSERKKRRRSASHHDEAGGRRRSRRRTSEPEPEEVPNSQEIPASQGTNLAAVEEQREEATAGSVRADAELDSSALEQQAAQAPSFVSISSMELEEGDVEYELQSQIVLESREQSQREQSEAKIEIADVDGLQRADGETVKDHGEDATATSSEGAPTLKASEPEAKTPGAAATILDLLRGGLAGLRRAALSRDEVYLIEDMCMDIKRELYDAEKRGRKS